MKLFFRKSGNGPSLLILHGLYGSSDNWVTIAKMLSGKFTVYLPDLRNHGQSPHSQQHDYDSMSQDILELADELSLDRFILAGHSMGGKVAVDFARKWPERIYSLVIIDIFPFEKADPDLQIYREHMHILGSMLSLDLKKAAGRADIERMLMGKIDDEKIRNLILKNLKRLPDNTFEWKVDAMSLYNNLDNIASGLEDPLPGEIITGFPVLFIKGERSVYLEEEDMKKIRQLFPGAEMTVIKDAGHWVHAEQPEKAAGIFLSLL